MKKLIVTTLIVALVAGSAFAKIMLPDAEEIALDNGLTIVIIEKHNLPLFSFQMTFPVLASIPTKEFSTIAAIIFLPPRSTIMGEE